MKTIIAGSRTVKDYKTVEEAVIKSEFKITEVVSGCAKGVDSLGESYAGFNRLPVKKYPADWERFGKIAGFIRNQKMADYAEALVAVWDGQSKGTEHMINIARQRNLKVFVHQVEVA